MTEINRERVIDEIVNQIQMHLASTRVIADQIEKHPESWIGTHPELEREKYASIVGALRALAIALSIDDEVVQRLNIPPDMQ